MWTPLLEALPAGHRAIAVDLPGHGESPSLPGHAMNDVVDVVHDAVVEAGLDRPIVIGHSLAAGLASIYAARYPAAAVVNVDSPIRLSPFAGIVHSLLPELTGDGFDRVWAGLRAGMRIETLDDDAQALLRAGDTASRELVLSYWRDLIARGVDGIDRWVEQTLVALREAAVPYLAVYGSPIPDDDERWIAERLPQARILVWPVGNHFPHLAEPDRFAALVTGLAAGMLRNETGREMGGAQVAVSVAR